MRLAPSATIASIALACACASQPAPARSGVLAAQANGPSIAPSASDLSRERELVEAARAAIASVDLTMARTKAGEAIRSLLAKSAAGAGTEWLELLKFAGHAAIDAQDAGAARLAWERIVEVCSRTLPEEHPDLQSSRLVLAIAKKAQGDLEGARELEEKVLAIFTQTLPDDHADLQKARLNLATTIYKLGDLPRARALQEKALEVFSRTLPDDHPHLQAVRLNLGATLFTLGDLEAARSLFEKVLAVRSKTLPDDHPDLQMARMNLAAAMQGLGDLEGSRPLFEKAVEVLTRTLPDDHPQLQWARGNLATTIHALGDLAGALALEEKVLEVRARTLPEDHPDLQTARLNLAVTQYELGDLATARSLEERVLEVRSRTLPDDHPDLQAARGNLGATLRTLGDFAGARALFEKVLDVFSRTLPPDHPDLQIARTNLALVLRSLGDLEGARALLEQVLEIRSRTLPDDHPDLQSARAYLAAALESLGDFTGARPLQEKVLEVRTRSLPAGHRDLQMARGNLALTLAALGDRSRVRDLHEKVFAAFSKLLPDDHPDLQKARVNLVLAITAGNAATGAVAADATAKEDREEFAHLASSFIRAASRSARAAVLTTSGREAEERCANASSDLGCALSFAEGLGVLPEDGELEREAFVSSETARGAALASAHLARRASADPRYRKLREEERSASGDLARLAQKGAPSDELDAARTRGEKAERDLVGLARELSGGDAGLLELDASALSRSLADGDALVGYRRYARWRHDGASLKPSSTESLCAFVLRSGNRLQRVELGAIGAIEVAVERWREAIGVRLERGLGVASDSAKEELESGTELRRLVFDPLVPALKGAERVVVAPDDALVLVPIDALPLEAGALVGDRWRMETRAALAELGWREGAPQGEALLALGGASFNLAPEPLSAAESAELPEEERADEVAAIPASAQAPSLLRGGAWERGFEPLTHSGPEARGIAGLYGEAFDDKRPVLVLEKRKASRASLAELAPKARFLHVATHGWFVPESVRSTADPEPLDAQTGFGARMSGEERARRMSPMLLCGLALAGANSKEDDLGRTPGLITAEELATLDLSGCELAVLSACDTNVGERRAGQGVASLQKALHMAGARSVITSLWKVPDEATRELMLDFYRRIWIEKKPKSVALWEAKTRIRKAKDESGRALYSTRDWAAWVLRGNPE